jgi:hypothetical protein
MRIMPGCVHSGARAACGSGARLITAGFGSSLSVAGAPSATTGCARCNGKTGKKTVDACRNLRSAKSEDPRNVDGSGTKSVDLLHHAHQAQLFAPQERGADLRRLKARESGHWILNKHRALCVQATLTLARGMDIFLVPAHLGAGGESGHTKVLKFVLPAAAKSLWLGLVSLNALTRCRDKQSSGSNRLSWAVLVGTVEDTSRAHLAWLALAQFSVFSIDHAGPGMFKRGCVPRRHVGRCCWVQLRRVGAYSLQLSNDLLECSGLGCALNNDPLRRDEESNSVHSANILRCKFYFAVSMRLILL